MKRIAICLTAVILSANCFVPPAQQAVFTLGAAIPLSMMILQYAAEKIPLDAGSREGDGYGGQE